MKKPKQPIVFATYSQWLKAYQQCPGILAADLLMIFMPIKTDEDKGVHNHMVAKIMEFCPSKNIGTLEDPIMDQTMLINVANTIVQTSKESHNPKPDRKIV